MSKKKFLIILLMFFSSILLAQSRPQVANLVVGKYVIKLLDNPDSTYGYAIYDANKIIVQQKVKPFGNSKSGFREMQNVFVVAIWQANELNEGRFKPIALDLKKAKELGITKGDL